MAGSEIAIYLFLFLYLFLPDLIIVIFSSPLHLPRLPKTCTLLKTLLFKCSPLESEDFTSLLIF